jgi:hypothetical protein
MAYPYICCGKTGSGSVTALGRGCNRSWGDNLASALSLLGLQGSQTLFQPVNALQQLPLSLGERRVVRVLGRRWPVQFSHA